MSQSKSRVLVPITAPSPERAEALALSVCEGHGADLYLVGPQSSPGQTPSTPPEERLERASPGEVQSLSLDEGRGVNLAGGIRVGHSLESLVTNAASDHDVELVVLDSDMFPARSRLRRSKVRRIAQRATCDVLVVSGPGSLEDMRTILVPIADGPHSGLAVEAATAIASARDVWIDVLHIVPPSASRKDREQADRMLRDALGRFDSDRADDWLLEADDVAEAILEESTHYDLTIMGTPERNRLKRFLFGSTTDSVVSESTVPVLVSWRNQP